jgi:glycosyltransferase involved in cell wall biosynthesis
MTAELGISGLVLMYVGNLEPYQGVDLLLESFALVLKKRDIADLVIIGGEAVDIAKYQSMSVHLGSGAKVHFLGPQPLERLANSLSEADILVSPRIKGNNTPMKVYSYLHSGKAVLATNLPTHTQLLDNKVALLADPCPGSFSEAMLRLIEDGNLRKSLGTAGRRFVEERFTYAAFREKLDGFFHSMESDKRQKRTPGVAKHEPKNL